MTQPQTVVEMTGITKQFPGVKALSGVDLRLRAGEIHALMGENGAGKSTLIKVLTGVHPADAGQVLLAGEPVQIRGPLQAQQAGISTVYQEVNLCPNLSVAENIFIGREPRAFGRIRWKEMRRRAAELLGRLQLDLDVSAPLASYSLAIQQIVAIVRAVSVSAKVLILDEPTSSLDRGEVEQLFGVMRRLRADGVAVVFVTHFLEQVYEVCDRITILRNGSLVGEYEVAQLTRLDLVARMIGKELQVLEALEEQPRSERAVVERQEPFVRTESVGRKGSIAPFSLDIYPGEVVGLAGLLGSGRTEAARLIFGADRADAGRVLIGGRPVSLRTPRAAIARDVAFSPENRKTEGLVADLTVGENMVLALQAARGWARPLPARRRDEVVEKYIKALNIRPADPQALVRNLSGGNQQKVLLARWLITQPKLLILDEPTRGIDVGAKAEIQKLVVALAEDGMAVLFISAELEEVLRLSHKVAVLRDRHLVGEFTNDERLTAERIMETIASGAPA
ncbi:MAG TPA: sugar ABC transporter ATP-binding protein [Pilimelia sp.]|nr:sugar ABC transporter ATP-binding protein [Pilimelia sp.]